ncbi:MAG TPA: hypothetical protein VJ257_01315 [Solirubrobacterales bacterium]|jgi:hypothetical protein|nr:hypothetical protein [Solirubrobacterales bacterium]
MSKSESPLDETHTRELLRGERERIEGSLADREQVRESELDEIDTDTDLLDEGEMIEEEQVDVGREGAAARRLLCLD